MDICGGQGIYIPSSGSCGDCDAFEQRVKTLETQLAAALNRITELESTSDSQAATINTINQTVTTHSNQISTLDTDLEVVETLLDGMNAVDIEKVDTDGTTTVTVLGKVTHS